MDETIDHILIPLGAEDDGTVLSYSLDEVPAILVAGTTGSGKSSFVKTLIAETMVDHTPSDVRFLIGDSGYPQLFVILDDFVALEPSKDMLASLERILQTARRTKMHVILVTSLPSSRLLTSELLSNIDCRVAEPTIAWMGTFTTSLYCLEPFL